MEPTAAKTLDLPAGLRGIFLRAVSPLRSLSKNLRRPRPQASANPRATLEAFCEAEFKGNEEAHTLMTQSWARDFESTGRFPGTALTLLDRATGSYGCDPAVAVRGYRIMAFAVEGDRAVAEVEYEVAGEFRRVNNSLCACKFVVPALRILQERITLRYDDGRHPPGRARAWYVEDPPLPKVSVEALLRQCLKKRDCFQSIAQKTGQKGQPALSTITAFLAAYEEKVRVLERLLQV